jgi:hypothetical protein
LPSAEGTAVEPAAAEPEGGGVPDDGVDPTAEMVDDPAAEIVEDAAAAVDAELANVETPMEQSVSVSQGEQVSVPDLSAQVEQKSDPDLSAAESETPQDPSAPPDRE